MNTADLGEVLIQLDHLSQCAPTWREFWGGFIRRLIGSLDGAACAVWIVENGSTALHYQANLPETFNESRRALRRSHAPVLEDVAKRQVALADPPELVAPLRAMGRDFGLLLAPVTCHGETRYVVELATIASNPEALANLAEACRIASRYVTGLSDRGSRETPRPERSWTQWLLQSFVFVAICGLGLLVSLRLGIVVAVLLLGYLFVQPTRKVDEVA